MEKKALRLVLIEALYIVMSSHIVYYYGAFCPIHYRRVPNPPFSVRFRVGIGGLQ